MGLAPGKAHRALHDPHPPGATAGQAAWSRLFNLRGWWKQPLSMKEQVDGGVADGVEREPTGIYLP
jgi:hypothetical protein